MKMTEWTCSGGSYSQGGASATYYVEPCDCGCREAIRVAHEFAPPDFDAMDAGLIVAQNPAWHGGE